MKDYGGRTERHVASVRAGGDLLVNLIHWEGGDRDVWEVQTFDNSGNPMAVFGSFLSEPTALGMFPTLIALARECYGRTKPCSINEFDCVSWTYRTKNGPVTNPDGTQWNWVFDDESLDRNLGTFVHPKSTK
jgi:hypothetical protein